MSTYYYAACHDCRVVGMLPKTSMPDAWAKEWARQYGHETHNIECASEYDDQFDARVNGRKIVGYHEFFCEPITEIVDKPYRDVVKETLYLRWEDDEK